MDSFMSFSVKALKQMLSLYRREHSILGYSKMRKHELVTEIDKVFVFRNGKLYRRADIAPVVPVVPAASGKKEKKRIVPQKVETSTVHPAFHAPAPKLTKGQERVENVVTHLEKHYAARPNNDEDEDPDLAFRARGKKKKNIKKHKKILKIILKMKKNKKHQNFINKKLINEEKNQN